MELRIPENAMIRKFVLALGLDEKYGRLIMRHIVSFLTAMAVKGFAGKMVDVAQISGCHRTTLSHFLSKSPWDEASLKDCIKERAMQHVAQLAQQTWQAVFVSIDDTVNCKRMPSSQALRPTQGTAFHHSHLLGKRVWSHQAQAVMVSCGKTALSYDIRHYNKTQQTKIESAVDVIKGLAVAKTKSYVLTDSWYTNRKIIDACATRGYHFIGVDIPSEKSATHYK